VPRPVELCLVVARVLDLLAGEAERRSIGLVREVTGEPGSSRVAGEEERLRQVLVNLTLNAIEATPDGGTVRVRCGPEVGDPAPGAPGPGVCVLIEDSGPGVPVAARDRIFEPFFTSKAKGSGLGLSIVHAIVAQHGGSVEVDDAPGGGARFNLRLPRLTSS
jgi:signal transduction histidine kinase